MSFDQTQTTNYQVEQDQSDSNYHFTLITESKTLPSSVNQQTANGANFPGGVFSQNSDSVSNSIVNENHKRVEITVLSSSSAT